MITLTIQADAEFAGGGATVGFLEVLKEIFTSCTLYTSLNETVNEALSGLSLTSLCFVPLSLWLPGRKASAAP